MKGIVAIVGAALVMTITPEPTQAADPPRHCPDPSKLRGLCGMVTSKIAAPANKPDFEYLFESTIYEASCADYNNDCDEIISTKIRALFELSQPILLCEGANFDVAQGNIFKYAVNSRTFSFIDQAIDDWKVNLNWIDAYDNTTLLDYVKRQVDRSRRTALYPSLNNYFNKLRRNGAKFRHE